MDPELGQVVDALPGLVWTALPDGQLDFLNQRWCEYTGLRADQASGWAWRAAIHPDDLPELLRRWSGALAAGQPADMEARLRRFDGEYRWFLIRTCPVVDAAGRILRWCGVNTDIEDHKRSEEALHACWWLWAPAREHHFVTVVDGIPGLAMLLTPAGEIELGNRQLVEYGGTTAVELRGRRIDHNVHPDDRADVLARWAQWVETGHPHDFEARLRRADGAYRWFRTRGFPLRDVEGQIAFFYLLQGDIDDGRRAEAMLTSEKRLLEMVATGESLAATLTQLGLEVERLCASCTGCSVLLPSPETRTLAVPDALADWWSAPITSREGRVLGILAISLDTPREPGQDERDVIAQMTHVASIAIERKQGEEALQESRAFLAQAQRISSTGGFSWRVSNDHIVWSEQVYHIFELDPARPVTLEIMGARLHPEDVPTFNDLLARQRALGTNFEHECRLLMPDAAVKFLHVVAQATRDQEGELLYIAAVQDVTQRRRAEAALGEVRSQLAHMARVTTLGTLTASIAHEVSQPLSGIITNASTCLRMLAADPPNVEGARETARRTIRDGHRAADVITRLRALFSKREVAAGPVDLNEAAREVIALTGTEMQRGRVILRTEFDGKLPRATGDRVQLQQVILNLLLNASDAMSDVHDRPRQVLLRTARDGAESVCMTVQDSGVGFGPDGMEHLFEPFYTTKRSGMGIGLAVSRSIIESHHGRLWAARNDGPGATFAFAIPQAPLVAGGYR